MTAAGHADDNQLLTFRAAVDDYLARHRHAEPAHILSRNAQRAGLEAVRSEWERHPADVETDLVYVRTRPEKDRYVAEGWTPRGCSTVQGVGAYWLEPPAEPSPVDGGP